jgi:lysozyme
MIWPKDGAVCAAAADLIAPFEGFKPKPYLCPANVWTIGYGTTVYPDGRRVGPHDPPIDKAKALALLQADVGKRWSDLKRSLHRPPTIYQAAAMLSLAYNIGVGAFAGSSVCTAFNAGDIAAAASAFLRWNKIKGRVSAGLTARRQAERKLFLEGEAGS